MSEKEDNPGNVVGGGAAAAQSSLRAWITGGRERLELVWETGVAHADRPRQLMLELDERVDAGIHRVFEGFHVIRHNLHPFLTVGACAFSVGVLSATLFRMGALRGAQNAAVAGMASALLLYPDVVDQMAEAGVDLAEQRKEDSAH